MRAITPRAGVVAVVCAGLSLLAAGCDPPSPGRADPSHATASRSDAGGAAVEHFSRRLRAELESVEDPWTLAHGVLAWGPELTCGSPPRSAVSRLLEDYLRQRPTGVGFDLGRPSAPVGALGEQHPHLVFRTLVVAGVGRELWPCLAHAALASFRPPASFQEWNDVAWLLEALAGSSRVEGNVTADEAWGESGWNGRRLARGVLERVEEGDRVVEAALARPDVPYARPSGSGGPERAGIYAYTCGGQHLLQGLLGAAEAGWLDAGERERLRVRLATYLKRMRAEIEFRERECARAVARGESPLRARRTSDMLLLKLLGHGLEILATAHRLQLGPRAELVELLRMVRARAVRIFVDLDSDLDPSRTLLPRLRAIAPHEWQLWFGDGCHALRGLRLADPILDRR